MFMKIICKARIRYLKIRTEVALSGIYKLKEYILLYPLSFSYLALSVPYKTSFLRRISVKLSVNTILGK